MLRKETMSQENTTFVHYRWSFKFKQWMVNSFSIFLILEMRRFLKLVTDFGVNQVTDLNVIVGSVTEHLRGSAPFHKCQSRTRQRLGVQHAVCHLTFYFFRIIHCTFLFFSLRHTDVPPSFGIDRCTHWQGRPSPFLGKSKISFYLL